MDSGYFFPQRTYGWSVMICPPLSAPVTTATVRHPFATGYEDSRATPPEGPVGAEADVDLAPLVVDCPVETVLPDVDFPSAFVVAGFLGAVAATWPPPPRRASPAGHEVTAVRDVPAAGSTDDLSSGALVTVLTAIAPDGPCFPAGPLAP